MTTVLLPTPPPFPALPHLNAWVAEPWHDGDTGLFRVDRWMRDYSTWSVRVIGMAARELGDPGGPEAAEALTTRLPVGAAVVLSTSKPDKYGQRKDAHVYYLGAGGQVLNLAAELILDGWAVPWNGRGVQPKPRWPRVSLR